MLHRYPLLFQPLPTAVVAFVTLLVMIGAEVTARYTAPAGFDVDVAPHVGLHLRHFALPNYWVFYDEEAIFQAISAQKDHLMAFLLHTAYNCAVGTSAVGVLSVFVTMLIATRALAKDSVGLRVAWAPAVAAFVFDMLEDLALLVIIIGYPTIRYPTLGAWTATCTLLKYASWLVMLAEWTILSVKMVIAPPDKERWD